MKRSRAGLLVIAALAALASAQPSLAAPDYVDVLSGQSTGSLEGGQPDYETVAVHVAYGHCAQNWVEAKTGLKLPGHWTFEIEPWLEAHTQTEGKVDLGTSFNLRIQPRGCGDLVPYLKGGTGVMVSSRDTLEQSTQWNFSSFGGAGIEARTGAESWLGLEWRIRHFSNLSIKDPNSGVDTTYWLLSYRQAL